jgi:hypothetical protein
MTYASYELKAVSSRVPSTGEDLGNALEKVARERIAAFDASDTKKHYTHLIPAIQLLSLAADAFRDAAKCSLGHNRRDRYWDHAERLRYEVEKLDARVTEYSDAYNADLKERLGF